MKTKGFLILLAVAAIIFILVRERKVASTIDVLPQVLQADIHPGHYNLDNLQKVSVPEPWMETARLMAADLQKTTGRQITVGTEKGDLNFHLNGTLSREAYRLNIGKKGIRIEAASISGMNHGFATLRQLILLSADGKLPAVDITDRPRYAYRGLMLDCSRHFWTPDELKKTIDRLALFKFNTLHLHLTDNQAWRMAMKKYPALTEAGTYYHDFPQLSGKYYTPEELKDVVRYAGLRGIEIIPEVDLPGHATALLAALPELSCNGGTFEAYPEERSVADRKRANENMVCIGNPKVFEFAADVVDALAEIFPSHYIHLGGDEVSTEIWQHCPKCQALFQREGMKQWSELQDYFTRRMSALIRAKGKTMIGWDEINDRGVATPEDVVMSWRNDGLQGQKAALERGIPVIMCPQHGCYYDWGYAGNSTRKIYEWEPAADSLPQAQKALVMGGQGNLWTERIATFDRVDWMLYPRMCALAEVLWTPSAQHNWESFSRRLTAFYPAMKTLGINFYDDDALNEKEFEPQEEKPALVRNARIETNIPTNAPYHAEYAFDGKTNSFFWGCATVNPGHYFSLLLGEPTTVNEVKVITGDSKDYITHGDLLVSKDGKNFVKVASFNELGEARATLDGEALLAVKIEVTAAHTCWPIIKEIILK